MLTVAFMAAVFYVERPLCAGNARSTKINEGPLLRIFSLLEKVVQCRLMIESGCLLLKSQRSPVGRFCQFGLMRRQGIVDPERTVSVCRNY